MLLFDDVNTHTVWRLCTSVALLFHAALYFFPPQFCGCVFVCLHSMLLTKFHWSTKFSLKPELFFDNVSSGLFKVPTNHLMCSVMVTLSVVVTVQNELEPIPDPFTILNKYIGQQAN